MHTTILDLQTLLHAQSKPTIITLTETKHRHIKSIWRHALKHYKLVYNPSLYSKQTKRTSAGTILAIHKDAYTNITPMQTPIPLQPYLSLALLQPTNGSKTIAASTYMPQYITPQGQQIYREVLDWQTKLLTDNHPDLPILRGGDLQATPHPNHNSHYPPSRNSAKPHLSPISETHIHPHTFPPIPP